MEKSELLAKARLLPATPGVYIMRDKFARVIYVGKSKALKNRFSSYFCLLYTSGRLCERLTAKNGKNA